MCSANTKSHSKTNVAPIASQRTTVHPKYIRKATWFPFVNVKLITLHLKQIKHSSICYYTVSINMIAFSIFTLKYCTCQTC